MFDTRLTEAKERWLAELYEANADAVLRVCWRVLSNPDDAADACQEAFLRAANSLDPDTPRDQARAWLLTVARNYCLDQIRRSKSFDRALTRFGTESHDNTDPETEVVNRHTVDDIFKQLNERERTVLWHTAVEHRSLNEVAERFHLSYMAAGQVVSRARKHAFALAAKVAAIFAVFRLVTRRIGAMPMKLVAAAAVPVVALTVQPSSSAARVSVPRAVSPAPVTASHQVLAAQAASTHGPKNVSPMGNASTLPVATPAVSLPSVSVPSPVSSAAGSVTGIVNQVLKKVPAATPLPTPTLPPLP